MGFLFIYFFSKSIKWTKVNSRVRLYVLSPWLKERSWSGRQQTFFSYIIVEPAWPTKHYQFFCGQPVDCVAGPVTPILPLWPLHCIDGLVNFYLLLWPLRCVAGSVTANLPLWPLHCIDGLVNSYLLLWPLHCVAGSVTANLPLWPLHCMDGLVNSYLLLWLLHCVAGPVFWGAGSCRRRGQVSLCHHNGILWTELMLYLSSGKKFSWFAISREIWQFLLLHLESFWKILQPAQMEIKHVRQSGSRERLQNGQANIKMLRI